MGGCAVDADCGEGRECVEGACEIGSECGGRTFRPEPILPNLAIVLDRSCSMRQTVGGVSKWEIAIEALNALTMRHEGQIRWGLTLFPDVVDPRCEQDAAFPVPIGDAREAAIRALLTAALDRDDPYHCEAGPCVTNIDTAVEQAASEPALTDSTRPSYVLLVSDGKQSSSCNGGSDARTEVAIERLRAGGVRTFVVGFGGEVDRGSLSTFATLGGTARAEEPVYFQADDAEALVGAFEDVAASIVSCEFAIDDVPAELERVSVFLDGALVARDEARADGWAVDGTTLTLFGSPCETLREGGELEVVFACEPSVD
ncbi:MAG: VWA domain-containing protein [Myxococcota bacterium]|jgi:hypothetical protein|nr:VWA domain-containing protein [Myxococcota bacterium]